MKKENNRFTENEVIQWRGLLEERKKLVLDSEEKLLTQAFKDLSTDVTGEISRLRRHSGDLATNTQTIETLELLSEKNIRSLQEIETSLERLDNGTFAECEGCHKPIPIKRLLIAPESRFCIDCQMDYEENQKRPAKEARPIPY
ncbi:MAG: molecular chaperone DnaK suppressor DksA [Oligoflexia bacterium]|nr:MAG: molecular chaperone DnaK suppressor DksA [Oligoflexia bacterium]